MRWTVITNCDSFFITKCDKVYYKLRQVLQSAMDLLQIATGITKCDDYYKLRQYRYVRKFELQAPTTWNKGLTRFRQSLHFSFRLNKTSGGSTPSDKGGGGGGAVTQILRKRGGPVSKKKFFRPFGPLFGLKLRGGPPPPAPSPRYATEEIRRLCSPTKNEEKMFQNL